MDEMIILLITIIAIQVFYLTEAQTLQNINVILVNEEDNMLAAKSLQVALNFIKRNPKMGINVDKLASITISGDDAKAILETLCENYHGMLEESKPPHILIDMTITGVPSECVKSFTAALALPTVSTSFGQPGDLRQWQNLDADQLQYLIQINPPTDIIPEIIRSVVLQQNISNAGILFDSTFVVDHKYKSLLLNVPTRHMMIEVEDAKSAAHFLTRFRDLDLVNFFILGRLSTIRTVLDVANSNKLFGRKYAWHAITQDQGQLKCGCSNASVMYMKPEPDPSTREKLNLLKTSYSLTAEPEITAVFYYDVIIRSLLAVKGMMDKSEWPQNFTYTTCKDYSAESEPRRKNFNLRRNLKLVTEAYSYAPIAIETNGKSHQIFQMRIERVTIHQGQAVSAETVGTWKAGLDTQLSVKDSSALANLSAVTIYRVVTVVQKPFVFETEENGVKKFKGYCIDLLEEIRKIMKFEYEIYVAPDSKFGNLDDNGQWNGMIKELIEKRAEIALGSLSVMAERENVVDFTVPYYDLVGITILMKKQRNPTSLFKFLTVLESDVWLCILAAYFFTSFLMWVFDRWSPYSYQNNREKYKDDEEKREFTLKECLWFCMTSLTPQGGGEAPKNLSGRLVAATWWLFGFIIIASYTANLAAFLTVSRLDSAIESLDDLAKQYKIQYAPVNGSSAMTYFERMANIESKFYEIWKDMTLNDSLSEVERSKLAVWDYPVSDKYTKMWQAMKEAKLPNNLDEAVARVLDSKSSSEGFAFLGDATDIKYLELTNCDLVAVGEEFSRKPYAIAVQQGSPLKDQFNNAILQLLNKRILEKLKEIWWNDNKDKKQCEKVEDQTDGISIHNIGGVFIVIFVGIAMAMITLGFEYWWYRYKRPPLAQTLQERARPGGMSGQPQPPGLDKLSVAALNKQLHSVRPRNTIRRDDYPMTGQLW